MILFLLQQDKKNFWRDVTQSRYTNQDTALYILAVILSLIVVGVILNSIFSERGRATRSQRRAFRRMAGVHGLGSSESGVLWRAAKAAQLDDPALIFVQRTIFENAASEVGSNMAQMESLRRKVYGP